MRLLAAVLLLIALLISALEWRDQRCAARVLTLMSEPPSPQLTRAALIASPQHHHPHLSPQSGERLSIWLKRAELSFQEARCAWWGEEVRVVVTCRTPCRSFEAVAR